MGRSDDCRICSLPEDLIVREIFPLMETKLILQTSSICQTCRNLWIEINHLNFERWSFKSHQHQQFTDLIYYVLQHRQHNNLHRLKFNYRILLYREDLDALTYNVGLYNANFVRAVFNYAASHNISEIETDMTLVFPVSIQDSETLTTLKFISDNYSLIRFPLRFKSLKTLHLYKVILTNNCCHNLVENCSNLETLELLDCEIRNPETLIRSKRVFVVNAPNLINLKVKNLKCRINGWFKPLKNLQIFSWRLKKLVMEETYESFMPKCVDLSGCKKGVEEVEVKMECVLGLKNVKYMEEMMVRWFFNVEMVNICLDNLWWKIVLSRDGYNGKLMFQEIQSERKPQW